MTYKPIKVIDPPHDGFYEGRTLSYPCKVTGICKNGYLRIKIKRRVIAAHGAINFQTKYVTPSAVDSDMPKYVKPLAGAARAMTLHGVELKRRWA